MSLSLPTLAMRRAFALTALAMTVACESRPNDDARPEASRGETIVSPRDADRAYCNRYAARVHECFPLTTLEPPEQLAGNCVARFQAERASGVFSPSEREALERCLAMPDCDAITNCMRGSD